MSSSFSSGSLYVGDLDNEVTETQLFDLFKQVGSVASIRVCRDAITRRSLGYAYVNYHSVVDAERALDTLNYTFVKNKPIRIMWCHRDPKIRKSGVGNIFIKNLDKSIDNKMLSDTFTSFGKILSCKVVLDHNGVSRGFGFVHYERQEEADSAIKNVNGKILANKQVFVGPWIPKKEKHVGAEKFTNVYVKNLDPSIDEARLNSLFEKYGKITKAAIMRTNTGSSRGFGFVNFSDPEEAKTAVAKLSGEEVEGKVLYVGRAQKKSEREAELKQRFEQIKLDRLNQYQGLNLYIKNLDDSIDDEKLKAEFASFGTITSSKVMRDEKLNSRGFGFVCFTTPEEATKAVTEMNGRILVSKPIYVALAQRREVRRAQLEAQHNRQAQAGLVGPRAIGPPQPLYPAPAGSTPPVFYPPGTPLPPGPRGQNYVYPQQMIPRTRWGSGPQTQQTTGAPPPGSYQSGPNFVVPTQRSQRQPRQRNGPPQSNSSSSGGRGQSNQQGNRRNFKYTTNVRNYPQQPGGSPEQGQAIGSELAGNENGGPKMSISSLAAGNPEESKQVLGETLFPLIAVQESALAAKITGMLLESMDLSELIHLVESNEDLAAKVAEARDVLQAHSQQEMPADEQS